MKTQFKPGDRVAYYSGDTRWVLKLSSIEGGILFFGEKDNPGHLNYIAHPKQCRRLVKRKRREIWVNEYNDGLTGSYYYASKKDAEKGNTTGDGYRRTIRFVEAKEKKE